MTERTPDLTRFTDAQRRRAEALSLVRFLWPVVDPLTAHKLALWLTTGRRSEVGHG